MHKSLFTSYRFQIIMLKKVWFQLEFEYFWMTEKNQICKLCLKGMGSHDIKLPPSTICLNSGHITTNYQWVWWGIEPVDSKTKNRKWEWKQKFIFVLSTFCSHHNHCHKRQQQSPSDQLPALSNHGAKFNTWSPLSCSSFAAQKCIMIETDLWLNSTYQFLFPKGWLYDQYGNCLTFCLQTCHVWPWTFLFSIHPQICG